MSKLTARLEFISDWVASKNLESFDCKSLGLTMQEIDDITKSLPFRIPDEFYELYQWHNGVKYPD
jgi:cell wall assembly regulator SMI1